MNDSDDPMHRFFEFGSTYARSSFLVVCDDGVDALEAYGRAEREPAGPVVLRWDGGRGVPGDAVWPDVGTLVASAHLLAVLAGFSGWRTFPVEVHSRAGEIVPGYTGVAVTGRCGPLCYDNSRVEGEGNWERYVGLRFDPATWDGSDVFGCPNGRWLLGTERIARALKAARIRNVVATRLSESWYFKESLDETPEFLCYRDRA